MTLITWDASSVRVFAGWVIQDGGWYLVPGKVDKISYLLLVFFAATLLFLFQFERMI